MQSTSPRARSHRRWEGRSRISCRPAEGSFESVAPFLGGGWRSTPRRGAGLRAGACVCESVRFFEGVCVINPVIRVSVQVYWLPPVFLKLLPVDFVARQPFATRPVKC
jgi:hypothetical protein